MANKSKLNLKGCIFTLKDMSVMFEEGMYLGAYHYLLHNDKDLNCDIETQKFDERSDIVFNRIIKARSRLKIIKK